MSKDNQQTGETTKFLAYLEIDHSEILNDR